MMKFSTMMRMRAMMRTMTQRLLLLRLHHYHPPGPPPPPPPPSLLLLLLLLLLSLLLYDDDGVFADEEDDEDDDEDDGAMSIVKTPSLSSPLPPLPSSTPVACRSYTVASNVRSSSQGSGWVCPSTANRPSALSNNNDVALEEQSTEREMI